MIGFTLPSAAPGALLALLADVTVRGSVLLGAVAGLAWLLRDRSAAVRHALWTAGILCFLALPALSANLPWRLKVLPTGAPTPATAPMGDDAGRAAADGRRDAAADAGSAARGAALHEADAAAAPDRLDPAAERELPAAGRRPLAPAPGLGFDEQPSAGATGAAGGGVALGYALFWLWLAGAALLCLRLVVGNVRVRGLLRRARELTDEASEREVFHLARRLGIGSYVRLLVSDEISMPITTGVSRPSIVLPQGFDAWSEDRLRAVILHELAHIHRRDVLSHLVSRVTCALHWFNPLAWHSAARLRTESERACDDLVLGAGTRASAYADHLLSILRSCSTVPSPATAIPMARRTEFEGRLLAILEPDARRAAAGRATILALAAAVAVVALPLAALAPADAEDTTLSDRGDARENAPRTSRRGDLESARSDGDVPSGSSARRGLDSESGLDLGIVLESGDADVQRDGALDVERRDGEVSGHDLRSAVSDMARAAGGAVADLVTSVLGQEPRDQESTRSRLISVLTPVLADDKVAETRRAAALALGDVEDPRAVEALSRALAEDPEPSVRRAAAWALGEIESPLAIPALARAAQTDSSQEVRDMAVWALGEIEHPEAIPALAQIATAGATPGIRRRAVWALGEIEHPDAIPTLSRIATSDGPMDLRRMAVWALGEIENRAAIPALGRIARDGSGPLRAEAIWALGEIEHPDAVEYLRAPLADSDPQIRRAAVWALGEIESERGVDVLAEALSDRDPQIRSMAIWALGEIESPRAVPHLIPLLKSGDAATRRRAAWALGEIESGEAAAALSGLVGDGDLDVRRTAVWALADIEDSRAVPALRRALSDQDRGIRFLALKGLAQIETDASVEAILDALESGDADMRRAATAALGRGDIDFDDLGIDFDIDFDFDFDQAFEGFQWGWDDSWDEWSSEPDPDSDF